TSACSAWRTICPCARTMVRMVVSDSTCSSWVCQPSSRATAANGNSWGSRQAHSWRPRVMTMPLWCGKTALPGMTWVWVAGRWHTCRASSSVPKRRARVIVSWPSAWRLAGGKSLAVLLDQRRIDRVPLGLEETAQDGVACNVGAGFQFVERRVGLESGDGDCRKIEGGEFSHLVARGIVHTADQDADVAHRVPLGQSGYPMLPDIWPGVVLLLLDPELVPGLIRAYPCGSRCPISLSQRPDHALLAPPTARDLGRYQEEGVGREFQERRARMAAQRTA